MRRNGGHGSRPGRAEGRNRSGGAIRTSRVAADLQKESTSDGACRDVADRERPGLCLAYGTGRGPLGPGRRLVRGDELGPWPSSPGRSGVAFPRPGCLLLVPPSVDPTAVGGVVAREPGGAAVRGAGPTGPEGPRHRLGASSRASVGQQHCHARIVPDPATANPPTTLERQPVQALTTGDGSPDRGPGRTAAGPAWSNRARRIVIRTLAGPRATPDTPEPWRLCAVLGAGHAGRGEGQGCKLLVQASARPGPRAVLAVPVELAGGAGRSARQLSGATPSVGRQRDDRRAGLRWGAGQSP